MNKMCKHALLCYFMEKYTPMIHFIHLIFQTLQDRDAFEVFPYNCIFFKNHMRAVLNLFRLKLFLFCLHPSTEQTHNYNEEIPIFCFTQINNPII